MEPRISRVLLVGLMAAACAAPERRKLAADSASTHVPLAQRDSLAVSTAARPDSTFADTALSTDSMLDTDSARLAYWEFWERLGRTRAQVIAALGAPVTTVGDTVRNEVDATTLDSIVTLRYRALEVRFYVRADGVDVPVYVAATDSSVKLPLRVGFGATPADLKRHFGAADFETRLGDTLYVQFVVPNDAVVQCDITFWFVHGAVWRIQWTNGLD